MRVFTAIALPPSVKDSLKPLLGAYIPTARWVHPADLHITLRFIGSVSEDALRRYREALATLTVPPFEVTLSGVGRFPENTHRPAKVMWVGIAPNPTLMTLQQSVSDALEAQGLQPDRISGYTPHITLARLKPNGPLPALDMFLREHADLTRPPFTVEHITLYRSERNPNGSHYHPVASYG